jgi:hypothetical protein
MWPFNRKSVQLPVPQPRAPGASRALRETPGPSPWYLDNTKIPCSTGTLQWHSAGGTGALAGKSILTDAAGLVYAITYFHCHVKAVHENQMLVWYIANHDAHSAVRLQLFSLDPLRPIPNWTEILPQVRASAPFFISTDPLGAVDLPTSLNDGSHVVSIPEVLSGLGELFFPVTSPPDEHREKHSGDMDLRLWILNTATGELEITPQVWFNKGPYDFGYQWVTRIARIPGTDQIVGEGIRLGVFLLDSTRTQVAEWLATGLY